MLGAPCARLFPANTGLRVSQTQCPAPGLGLLPAGPRASPFLCLGPRHQVCRTGARRLPQALGAQGGKAAGGGCLRGPGSECFSAPGPPAHPLWVCGPRSRRTAQAAPPRPNTGPLLPARARRADERYVQLGRGAGTGGLQSLPPLLCCQPGFRRRPPLRPRPPSRTARRPSQRPDCTFWSDSGHHHPTHSHPKG